MDFIYLRQHKDATTLTFHEANFGVDPPRVGDRLMIPGILRKEINAVVYEVVRKFRSCPTVLVQYDRHVFVDVGEQE